MHWRQSKYNTILWGKRPCPASPCLYALPIGFKFIKVQHSPNTPLPTSRTSHIVRHPVLNLDVHKEHGQRQWVVVLVS